MCQTKRCVGYLFSCSSKSALCTFYEGFHLLIYCVSMGSLNAKCQPFRYKLIAHLALTQCITGDETHFPDMVFIDWLAVCWRFHFHYRCRVTERKRSNFNVFGSDFLVRREGDRSIDMRITINTVMEMPGPNIFMHKRNHGMEWGTIPQFLEHIIIAIIFRSHAFVHIWY